MKTFRNALLSLFLIGGILAPQRLFAQAGLDDDLDAPAKKPAPIAVAMLSSIERAFTEMDFLFASIDHPELSDLIGVQLANVRDLKGIDRSKPLGVIVFLKPGLFPQPGVTGFVPVDDFAEFLQTMSIGPVQPVKVPDFDDRYQLGQNEGDLIFEKVGNYVFLTNDETLLDTELPDPASFTKILATRYDAAIELNIGNVPIAMRNFLLDFLRADMEAKMQQQDDEPDSVYRARKSASIVNLQNIEQLLQQGESIRIGLDVSEKLKKAVIEIDLNARPGSQFAKYLSDAGGKASYFRVLQNDPAILSGYISSELQKKDREFLKELSLSMKDIINYQLETEPPPGDETPQVRLDGLFDTLADTAEAGILDGFFRFQGEKQGEIVVMSALRVTNGTPAAATIGDLIDLITSYNHNDNYEVQLNAATHRGVTFHKVTPQIPAGRPAQAADAEATEGEEERATVRQADPTSRAFGEGWSMYFGAGERTLWFVLGAENAMPAANAAIDKILDPSAPQANETTAPFRFTLNMSKWMNIWENPERDRRGFGKLAMENFEQGDDQINIDMTTRENGIRYRIEFQEAFVRLVALGITRALGIQLEELE